MRKRLSKVGSMKRMRTFSRKLLFVIPLLFTSGCFLLDVTLEPEMFVTPGSVTLQSTNDLAVLSIRNIGGGDLAWTIEEVVRTSESSPWTPGDAPWFMIGEPGEPVTAGSTTVETDHVQLTALAGTTQVGILNNAGVRITQTGGDAEVIVVPISLIVYSPLHDGLLDYTFQYALH